MPTNLVNQMKKQIDEAPEAQPFVNANMGKLTITPYVMNWTEDETGKRMPERKELPEDYELQKGENFELLFSVDIQELNPALQFKYERNVQIRKSNLEVEPHILTDWSEIVEPSLLAVFGANWLEAVMKQPYVEIEDVPNITGRKGKPKDGKEGKIFGVPKFVHTFKSHSECEAAHAERFGKASANDAIPIEVITKTKGLLASLKGNDKKVLDMLAKKPFGDYDPEEILALAKVA